jgi:hypothetical protein
MRVLRGVADAVTAANRGQGSEGSANGGGGGGGGGRDAHDVNALATFGTAMKGESERLRSANKIHLEKLLHVFSQHYFDRRPFSLPSLWFKSIFF